MRRSDEEEERVGGGTKRTDGCGGERKRRAGVESVALRHSAAASLTDSLTADWLAGWLTG